MRSRIVSLLARRALAGDLRPKTHLSSAALGDPSRRLFSAFANESGKLRSGVVQGQHYYTRRCFHGTRASLAKDYYDILGVNKSSSASDIKKAYYGLAKKLHPDTNKGDKDAEKKFQEVQRAYETLKDGEKRALYDQVGPDLYERQQGGGGGGGDPFSGGFSFKDIFPGGGFDGFVQDIFNQPTFGGQDIKVMLQLSFMEAVEGCTKTVSFQTAVPCGTCGGTGVPPGIKPESCRDCKGAGTVYISKGPFRITHPCTSCHGVGKTAKSLCQSCEGQKVVRGTKSVKVDVIPGIDDGDTMKMPNKGGADTADPQGGRPGDLYVTVKVREDPVFRRENSDIHVDATIGVTQAILGGTIQVPTLKGDVVVKVKPGTQPGHKVVMRGKGVKDKHTGYYGNHYVHFIVNIPANLTERQRHLIEEFVKEEQGDCDKSQAANASG